MAVAEAEAAEAAKRTREIRRVLRKKRREEEMRAAHARKFYQASLPSSPARQLGIIKGNVYIALQSRSAHEETNNQGWEVSRHIVGRHCIGAIFDWVSVSKTHFWPS